MSASPPLIPYQNLIHYGNAAWRPSQPRNSAQQISLAALRLGLRVAYLGPATSPRIPRRGSRIRILAAGAQAQPEPDWILREFLADWEATPANTALVVSYATPRAAQLARWFGDQGFTVVNRHVDWFEEDPAVPQGFSRAALAELCQLAATVAISHPDLEANLPGPHHDIRVIRNGIDGCNFPGPGPQPQVPSDLRQGRLTLGFWGTFWGGLVDWGLIDWLARSNPDWQLNFIGDLQYLDIPGSPPANVHFLGGRHPRQLSAYLAHFDVCLAPFRQDHPLPRYANPIKVLEYLSGARPVVSPPNRSLEDYPGVFFYTTPEEARQRIVEAARYRFGPLQAQQLRDENLWERKLEELLLPRLAAGHG